MARDSDLLLLFFFSSSITSTHTTSRVVSRIVQGPPKLDSTGATSYCTTTTLFTLRTLIRLGFD